MPYPLTPTDGDFHVEDGVRRQWVAADQAWVKKPRYSRIYPHLKEANGDINPQIITDLDNGLIGLGDAIETAAYWAGSQYGGAHYLVATAATGVDDGGSFVDVASSTPVQLRAVFGDSVDITQFGARPDGTESTASIQAAIDHATHVYVPSGVFLVSGIRAGSALLATGKSISISGDGPSSILRIMGQDAEHTLLALVDCGKSSVNRLTLDGNCSLSGPVSWNIALDVRGSSEFKLESCTITRTGNTGARISWEGISTDTVPNGSAQPSLVQVLGNSFVDCWGSGALTTKGGGASRLILSGNLVQGFGIFGFSLEAQKTITASTEVMSDVICSNNVIVDGDSSRSSSNVCYGIDITEAVETVILSGNVIKTVRGGAIAAGVLIGTSPTQDDTDVSAVTIASNHIADIAASAGRSFGVTIDTGNGSIEGVDISGNRITDVGYGVALRPNRLSGTGTISEVQIASNFLSSNAASIWFATGDGATTSISRISIVNNSLFSLSDFGVFMLADRGFISGNRMAGAKGVRLLSPSEVDVWGNAYDVSGIEENILDVGALALHGGNYVWSDGGLLRHSDVRPVAATDGSVVAVISAGAARPATPLPGQPFFNTTTGQPEWWDGTAWVSALDDPAYTATGVVSGLALSSPLAGTTFDVGAGSYFVLDMSDPANPVRTLVEVGAGDFVAVSATELLAGEPFTYLFLDASKTLIQRATAPVAADIDNLVYLGNLTHDQGNLQISGPPTELGWMAYDSNTESIKRRFAEGTIRASGADIVWGANLQPTISAGDIDRLGASRTADPLSPGIVHIDGATYGDFSDPGLNITLDALVDGTVTPVQNVGLAPGTFDDGTSVPATSGPSRFNRHFFWGFPRTNGGVVVVHQFDSQDYGTLAEAQAGVAPVGIPFLGEAFYFGELIIPASSTDPAADLVSGDATWRPSSTVAGLFR